MTPERWQQIKALLEEALERDPRERDAFLDEACTGDSNLRAEVEALIDSHARSGDFIESPAYEVLADSLTQTDLVPSTAIGPYEIIRRLGSGGMGDIYLAEDTRLGRKVALKTLPVHFTKDAERVRRFQLEAKAASALNHPNIITIYEIGQLDQLHYIVFEFVDGQTLRQRMTTAPFTIAEALQVASSVAAALLGAHEAGIVHRDVKPENIMMRADGFVKMLDFGLAKLTERKQAVSEALTLFQTEPGIVMGTAPYMSPEQARGLGIDPRTDIWSLGVVVYEMLAGRPPFAGPTNSDVLVAILGREPVPLPRYRPEVPTELEWIIKKALRKDRDERYQTAKELLADLKNLAQRLDFEQELERSLDTTDARNPAYQSQAKSSSPAIDSLAILPVQHNESEPGMEYFSDGISESMINALSRLPDLRVMAWSTVSQYKARQIDPRQVGRELQVRAVVTGRMMQSTDRLVIKLELVDVRDGSQLWADNYTCNPADVLDIETQISSEISERLLLRITNEERKQLAKRPTDNVEAYHAYLKGRYCWNKRTDEDVRKAIEYFKKAIDSDPTYALAYVGLADSYMVLGGSGIATLAPKDAYPKAREAVERALEIDDTLAEAHASLGYCLANYDWNWTAAEREFKRALELKPGYAVAHHWYGFLFLASFGRLDEAITEMQHALKLDPLSLPVGSNIGLILYLARRYEEALDHFWRNLEMDRSFVYTHWQMAMAYEECGRYDEAIAAFRKAIALSGTSTLPHTLLARTYARSGRKSEALALLDELNELSTQHYVSPYRIAAVYAALGDKDRAFKWLEHAYEARDCWLIWLAVDPVFDSLRSDERLTELLHRIGLRTVRGPVPAKGVSGSHLIPSTQAEPQPRHSFVGRFGPAMLVALLAVLLLTAGYLLVMFLGGRRTAVGPQSVSFQQVTYQSGPEFFPSLSPDGKSTIYASQASGNWDIFFQRIGEGDVINLTKDFVKDDSQPAFSPDGEHIAFRSERDGGGVYVMNANGASPVRVSDFGYSPSWSADGGQILVGTEKIPQPSTRPTKSQLWMIDLKSGQRQRISEGDALQPTFSPHHKRIAYWSRPDRYGQREHIWTIPFSGGEPVAVTDGSSTDLNPVWSPDGNYLYFSSNRGGSSNIWRLAIDEDTGVVSGNPEAVTTMGANTSVLYLSFSRTGQLAYSAQADIRNLRRISFSTTQGAFGKPAPVTQGSLQLWFPDVSPDGEWLTAYSMGQQRHIYIMRADGTNQRDLTPDNYRHSWPRWSPDGQRIAFTSRRTGDYELWIMNRDGSGLRQLSQSGGGHYSPWSADGSMIAYSIHTPKNDCVIINPEKAWSEQKFVYLSPLSDASLSFEGWSWSADGKKLAGIRHLPNGVHSGIGIYDLEAKTYDWLTDFGDWPIWLNDNRHLLFVSQGTIYLFDTHSRKYHQVFVVTDQDVDIGTPAISRDNRTLYFTYVAAEADIWLMDLATK
jgi:serine/threonine protein kinase/Tol biopolymer transport system component/Tfp pilus assembly protein PilF